MKNCIDNLSLAMPLGILNGCSCCSPPFPKNPQMSEMEVISRFLSICPGFKSNYRLNQLFLLRSHRRTISGFKRGEASLNIKYRASEHSSHSCAHRGGICASHPVGPGFYSRCSLIFSIDVVEIAQLRSGQCREVNNVDQTHIFLLFTTS